MMPLIGLLIYPAATVNSRAETLLLKSVIYQISVFGSFMPAWKTWAAVNVRPHPVALCHLDLLGLRREAVHQDNTGWSIAWVNGPKILALLATCFSLLGGTQNASAADAPLTPAQLAFFKQADDALTELEKYVAPERAMQAEEEYEEALPLMQSASGPTPKGFALLGHAADLGDVRAQVQFAGLMAKYGRNNVSAH